MQRKADNSLLFDRFEQIETWLELELRLGRLHGGSNESQIEAFVRDTVC